jgi:hypothetical protein
MDVEQLPRTRPGARRMAPTRKSAFEKIAEKQKIAEEAEHEVAALKAQIRENERRKDTRRKVLGGAMAFAHAQLDPAWREAYANVLQKVGAAMKTERSRAEAAQLEKWVRGGCLDIDIDSMVEEAQRTKNTAAPEPAPPSETPPPSKSRNPAPQG